MSLTRRHMLASTIGTVACAVALLTPKHTRGTDEVEDFLFRITGRKATPLESASPRDAGGILDRVYGAHEHLGR